MIILLYKLRLLLHIVEEDVHLPDVALSDSVNTNTHDILNKFPTILSVSS